MLVKNIQANDEEVAQNIQVLNSFMQAKQNLETFQLIIQDDVSLGKDLIELYNKGILKEISLLEGLPPAFWAECSKKFLCDTTQKDV